MSVELTKDQKNAGSKVSAEEKLINDQPAVALLVVDVQDSFKHARYWDERELPRFQTNVSQLIETARAQQWQVVYVLHNENSGVFSPESGYVRLMDFVTREPQDMLFNKGVHNAMTDSGLHEWLTEQGIQQLKICGIRTEQCCETTTRVASDLGYQVDYVMDATLTFPMTHPLTGVVVSSEEIYQKTALVLHERFARITSVQDYL